MDPTPPLIPPLDSSLTSNEAFLCSPESIVNLISSLPNRTSSGPDGISSLLLKSTAYSIAVPLQHIFNLSISTGSFPSIWKRSTVIPIPKTIPPSSSPGDYRPISLLSLVSKLLERHIFNILLDHLYADGTLSDEQFGFLPNRSTTSALLSATQYIFSSLDRGVPMFGVFLDVRKAFDSVSHRLLIEKLLLHHVPLNLVHWFNSYLCNRSQCVRVCNDYSVPAPVYSGVPQGSILGPLLFVLFINDIGSLSLSPHSKLILFADDILLLHPLQSSSDLSPIQSDLNSITSWLSLNLLSVNPAKSKYMIFALKSQQCFDYLPPLQLNNLSIARVFTFRYLGILLSCNMTWASHISSISKKAKRLLGLIYRQFYKNSSTNTLLSLYLTIVRPVLEYGSPIWDPPSFSLSSTLESVQHFALKLASKSWSQSYDSLLSSLNICSLAHRRMKAKLSLFYKITHHLHHSTAPQCQHHIPARPLRYSSHLNFTVPFCRTSRYLNSFFPSTIRLWNNLPSSAKNSTSLSYFKFYINCKL